MFCVSAWGSLLPRWLYPGPELVLLALGVGLLLDYAYPFHRGVLLKLHPVRTCFMLALRLGRHFSSRIRGVLVWLAAAGSHIILCALLLYVAWRIHWIAWLAVASVIVKLSIPVRLLFDTVDKAVHKMISGDLEGAKRLVQGLVRRDLGGAGEGYVCSAAIESLFESLVDAVASPLLFYSVGGPLAAFVQRMANTMDGALGFKTPEYEKVGWFSAAVDTVLNYIPARLTALITIIICVLAGSSPRRVFSVYVRFRNATESINAGHPMSAAAACLGVKLEKKGHYSLGEGTLPNPHHMYRALKLALAVLFVLVSLTIVLVFLLC